MDSLYRTPGRPGAVRRMSFAEMMPAGCAVALVVLGALACAWLYPDRIAVSMVGALLLLFVGATTRRIEVRHDEAGDTLRFSRRLWPFPAAPPFLEVQRSRVRDVVVKVQPGGHEGGDTTMPALVLEDGENVAIAHWASGTGAADAAVERVRAFLAAG